MRRITHNEFKRSEAIKLGANVLIEIRDASTGELIKSIDEHNLVVLAGRNAIRDFLSNTPPVGITHFAVGTGTTPAAAGDVALGTEVLRDVVTKRTPDIGSLNLQYYLTSTSANGYSLTEAGLFNAASGGTMFARVTHAAIAKTSSITVTYSWTININAS